MNTDLLECLKKIEYNCFVNKGKGFEEEGEFIRWHDKYSARKKLFGKLEWVREDCRPVEKIAEYETFLNSLPSGITYEKNEYNIAVGFAMGDFPKSEYDTGKRGYEIQYKIIISDQYAKKIYNTKLYITERNTTVIAEAKTFAKRIKEVHSEVYAKLYNAFLNGCKFITFDGIGNRLSANKPIVLNGNMLVTFAELGMQRLNSVSQILGLELGFAEDMITNNPEVDWIYVGVNGEENHGVVTVYSSPKPESCNQKNLTAW